MMKKYTTTNQSTVSVMGGGCVTRFDLDGTCEGDDIFVEKQVGRSPFGTKKRSTEIKSMIPLQKSKDLSRTQNPTFASYLCPSEGQNLKGCK